MTRNKKKIREQPKKIYTIKTYFPDGRYSKQGIRATSRDKAIDKFKRNHRIKRLPNGTVVSRGK
jgi:hypothetical protein